MRKTSLVLTFLLLMLIFLVSCNKVGIVRINQCNTDNDCVTLYSNNSNLPGPEPKYICKDYACIRNLD